MATKTTRSLKVSCPECGASESISLDLNDLAVCTCSSCSEEFSPEQARDKAAAELAKWVAVCEWIAGAPTV